MFTNAFKMWEQNSPQCIYVDSYYHPRMYYYVETFTFLFYKIRNCYGDETSLDTFPSKQIWRTYGGRISFVYIFENFK